MEIKIYCDCGQHYKFDVEPLNGRMPSTVRCPACGLDGTAKANSIIQRILEDSRANPSTKIMQDRHRTNTAQGFHLSLGDIYHVLFRHKWKILAIWIIGFATAAGIHFFWPVPYTSTARLYINYVQNARPFSYINSQGGMDPTLSVTTAGPDSIINTEMEILTGGGVSYLAAQTLDPETISKLHIDTTNTSVIGAVIQNGLDVQPGGTRDPVIHVFFKNKERSVVQPILAKVISSYRAESDKLHRVGGSDGENLSKAADELKSKLSSTEEDLRKLKEQVDVTQLAETKKMNAETLSKIQDDIRTAETDLAVHQALLDSATNPASAEIEKTDTNAPVATTAVPVEAKATYAEACENLETLRKRKEDLLLLFTPTNSRVVTVQQQIDDRQKIKSQLETQYPQLLSFHVTSTSEGVKIETNPVDANVERTKILGLKKQLEKLREYETQTRAQIDKVAAAEQQIRTLERSRDEQEQSLMIIERKRTEAQIDNSLNGEQASGIGVVQEPSLPFKDPSKLNKIVLMVLFGSIAAGLGLAFAIEFYFDRSFKRPAEIETRLGLPLFLSIPETNGHGKRRLPQRNVRLLTTGNGDGKERKPGSPAEPEASELPAWKPDKEMDPFFEALRDRLITHFEVKEINHKPKLVALTSCSQGSGVSTVASGLAASLSETGEGNVLLVDMNLENGAAHFFHKGKLACGLDEVLDKEGNRENAQVEKNLFVVTENAADEKLPRILHKRFSALIPKLHASDFDYIIFDMPPVSQTSATTRVARFMDMVLMVVEAEKTDGDVVKRASKMLAEAKAENVGVVLNKLRNYLPERLSQQL